MSSCYRCTYVHSPYLLISLSLYKPRVSILATERRSKSYETRRREGKRGRETRLSFLRDVSKPVKMPDRTAFESIEPSTSTSFHAVFHTFECGSIRPFCHERKQKGKQTLSLTLRWISVLINFVASRITARNERKKRGRNEKKKVNHAHSSRCIQQAFVRSFKRDIVIPT